MRVLHIFCIHVLKNYKTIKKIGLLTYLLTYKLTAGRFDTRNPVISNLGRILMN